MNASSSRRIVAQTAIISAVAAGAWHFGVRPMAAAAARAEATLRAERAELAAPAVDAREGPSARIDRARSELRRLEMLSDRASVAANLYDQVSTIAARADVRVQRIDPKGVVSPIRDATGRTAHSITGSLCTIEVSGGFDRIAEFTRLLQAETGLSRVVSIRLAPAHATEESAEAPGRLTATIELAQFRFGVESDATSKRHGARGDVK